MQQSDTCYGVYEGGEVGGGVGENEEHCQYRSNVVEVPDNEEAGSDSLGEGGKEGGRGNRG